MSSQSGAPAPSLSIADTAFSQTNIVINTTFNALSIVGGLLVLLITFGLWQHDHRLMNRVSLRINAFVSLIDALRSAIVLAYTYMTEDTPKEICTWSAWLIIFTVDLYLFLSAAIAFNLQWVVLQEKKFAPWMERYLYYGGSLVLSLLFSCIPLIAGRFGWDQAQAMCWYRDSWKTSSIIWEWFSYLGPAVAVIIYCNVVVGLVIRKIITTNRALRKHIGSSHSGKISTIQRNTQCAINRVLGRIVLYPFIPFITQAPFIASETYMHSRGEINKWLSLFGNIATDSPGILNFIALLIDPSLYNALARVRRDLVEKYAQPTHFQLTNLSLEAESKPMVSSTCKHRFMCWFVNTFLHPNPELKNPHDESQIIPSARQQNWHVLASKEDEPLNSVLDSTSQASIINDDPYKMNSYQPKVSVVQSDDKHLGSSAARCYIQNL